MLTGVIGDIFIYLYYGSFIFCISLTKFFPFQKIYYIILIKVSDLNWYHLYILKICSTEKLLARLTIPIVIRPVMLGILIIDLFNLPVPAITFAWILVGMIIGYPFGHLTKISWNSDKTQLALVGSRNVTLCSFHYNPNYREHNHSHRIWLFILRISYYIACLSWSYNWQDTWNDKAD